jgi:DNA-binding phage protein
MALRSNGRSKPVKGGTYKLYTSYSFIEKDPIIDKLRTVVSDQHAKYSTIEKDSGVSSTTLHNWFKGDTKRPQFATVMAVARALGHDLELVDRVGGSRMALPTAKQLTRRSNIDKRTG